MKHIFFSLAQSCSLFPRPLFSVECLELRTKSFKNGGTSNEKQTTTFLTVEIRTPVVDPDKNRIRSRTARQLSWLYLLKFQHFASSLAWIANSFVFLIRTANRRIANDSPSSSVSSSARLYRLIKGFLLLVMLLLCFEFAAYFKGWHFTPPSVASAEVAVEVVYARWLEIRAVYIAPPLQSLTNVCIVLFLIQLVDRLVLVLGCFWIKLRRISGLFKLEVLTSG